MICNRKCLFISRVDKVKLFLINILLQKSVSATDLHCRFAIAVLISFVLKIQLIQVLFNKDNCW